MARLGARPEGDSSLTSASSLPTALPDPLTDADEEMGPVPSPVFLPTDASFNGVGDFELDEHIALCTLLRWLCDDFDCYGEAYASPPGLLTFAKNCFPRSDAKVLHSFAHGITDEVGIAAELIILNTEGSTEASLQVVPLAGGPGPAAGDWAGDLLHYILRQRMALALTLFRACVIIRYEAGLVVLFFLDVPPRGPGFVDHVRALEKTSLAVERTTHQRAAFVARRQRIQRCRRVMAIALVFFLPLLRGWARRTRSAAFISLPIGEPADHGTEKTPGTKLTARDVWAQLVGWFRSYFKKWRGGAIAMPPRLTWSHAALTLLCTFTFIGGVQLIFDAINNSGVMAQTEADPMILSPSFGAMATILYALPVSPLAQPRIVVVSHLIAMASAIPIGFAFGRGFLVWMQEGLACGLTISVMCKMGYPHPPAAALSVAFVSLYNSRLTNVGVGYMVLSAVICISFGLIVAIVLDNVHRRISYPVFW